KTHKLKAKQAVKHMYKQEKATNGSRGEDVAVERRPFVTRWKKKQRRPMLLLQHPSPQQGVVTGDGDAAATQR
ncbi:hypothetical protein BHM03_00017359, partial [Ensete ventricosum]